MGCMLGVNGGRGEREERRNPLETESQSGPAAGPREPSLCSEVRQPFWSLPRGVSTVTLDSMNSPGNPATVLETRWQHSTAPWDGSEEEPSFPPPPAAGISWHPLVGGVTLISASLHMFMFLVCLRFFVFHLRSIRVHRKSWVMSQQEPSNNLTFPLKPCELNFPGVRTTYALTFSEVHWLTKTAITVEHWNDADSDPNHLGLSSLNSNLLLGSVCGLTAL